MRTCCFIASLLSWYVYVTFTLVFLLARPCMFVVLEHLLQCLRSFVYIYVYLHYSVTVVPPCPVSPQAMTRNSSNTDSHYNCHHHGLSLQIPDFIIPTPQVLTSPISPRAFHAARGNLPLM